MPLPTGVFTVTAAAGSTRLATAAQLQARIAGLSDADANALIDVASAQIARACGRPLGITAGVETWRIRHSWHSTPEALVVTQWPVTTLTSLTVDGTALTEDEFEVDGALLWRLCGSDRARWCGTVALTYAGGYTLPAAGDQADLAEAALLLAVTRHVRQDVPSDRRSYTIEGVGSETRFSSAQGGGAVPADITTMLASYRSAWLG